MEFGSVCECLQELFPQLDAHLLKAVAIENSKDVDAAVEVVLSEILPYMTENATPPSCLPGNLFSQSHADEEAQEEDKGSTLMCHQTVEKVNASQSKFAGNANNHASNSTSYDPAPLALILEAPFWDGNDCIHQSDGAFVSKVVGEPKTVEEARSAPLTQFCDARLIAMHHLEVAEVPEELNGTAESEELIFLGDKPAASTRQTLCFGPSSIPNISNSGTSEGKADGKGSKGTRAHSADGGNEHHQAKNEDIFIANLVCQSEPLLVQKEAPKANFTDNIYTEYLDDVDTTAEASDASLAIHYSGNGEALNMTRSPQIGEVDLLEQIIEDAKNNKKTLFSAMESVINTMKVVEEWEKAAEQAREEAAQKGSDVWRRVEELKRMIQSAKEANDMHAGEIYGERAILATEVRELQSRLLSLSDERDRSLAIIDEMRNALETCLAAAEEVIEAAEHDKHARMESAYKALKEQEALMEKVVHESKLLQEKAEENSKLREFLMDRGRIVDQLQGEIAVICEDVKLLKERFDFDSRVALNKSISCGQTISIIASSSSPLGSSASSDRIPDGGETCNAPYEATPRPILHRPSPRRGQGNERSRMPTQQRRVRWQVKGGSPVD